MPPALELHLPSRIPLVIGTTGHISAVVKLTQQEREALLAKLRDEVFTPLLESEAPEGWTQSIVRRYRRWTGQDAETGPKWRTGGAPHSLESPPALKGTPLRILSGLAEGADRLMIQAARMAAERLGRPGDVELVAVLPFDRAKTRSFFNNPNDPEFDELLDFASAERILSDRRSDAEKRSNSDRGKSLQYGLQGIAIARWSRLLIAVWDGKAFRGGPNSWKKRGGTAHVNHMARSGEIVNAELIDAARKIKGEGDDFFGFARDALDEIEPMPVVSVTTKETQPPRIDYPVRFVRDPEPYRKYQRAVLHRISEFNHASMKLAPGLSVERKKSRECMLLDGEAEKMGVPEQKMRHLFGDADSLATHYQAKAKNAYRSIYYTVFAAGVAFTFYSHVFALPVWITLALVAYAVLVFVAAQIHAYVERRGLEWRHWDMRALAEALRVQFAWRLLGFSASASPHYLQRQRSELDWVRAGLESASLTGNPTGASYATSRDKAATDSFKGAGLAAWVGGQYAYYRRNCHERGVKMALFHFLGSGLIVGSFAATGVALLHDIQAPIFRYPVAVALAIAAHLSLQSLSRQLDHVKSQQQEVRTAARKYLALGIGGGISFAMLALFAGEPLAKAIPGGWLLTKHHAWAVVSMAGPALVAALLHSYALSRAYEEEREKFHQMEAVYAGAIESLYVMLGVANPPPLNDEAATQTQLIALGPQLNSPEDPVCQLLLRLGQESLIEHADWVLMHRSRPVDLPHAM